MSNSVDPNETAQYDPCCLQKRVFIAGCSEGVKERNKFATDIVLIFVLNYFSEKVRLGIPADESHETDTSNLSFLWKKQQQANRKQTTNKIKMSSAAVVINTYRVREENKIFLKRKVPSRKHAYIILTPLNTTFI